jgi:uncharacterized protein DUF3515
MVDPVSRRAARLAALIALPVALVAGVVTFRVLAPGDGDEGAPRTGATTAVDVAAPSLAPRTAAVCRALLAKLPATLGDLARRPVTAGAEQNAAYGDPPVTVACGSTGPAPPPDPQLFAINGICWYAEDGKDARTWVLQGREVPLVVRVPTAYTGQDLVDLSTPIRDAVAEVAQLCRG